MGLKLHWEWFWSGKNPWQKPLPAVSFNILVQSWLTNPALQKLLTLADT